MSIAVQLVRPHVEIPQQKCAERRSDIGRAGVPGDYQLLTFLALHLEPVGVSSRCVGRILPFADDSLEPQRTGVLEHVVTRMIEMLGIENPAVLSLYSPSVFLAMYARPYDSYLRQKRVRAYEGRQG